MIRTYSDKLIALSKTTVDRNGTAITEVRAETTLNGVPKEVEITFYGEKAKEAKETLAPGVEFTFRGFVNVDDEGQIKLVAATFAAIA